MNDADILTIRQAQFDLERLSLKTDIHKLKTALVLARACLTQRDGLQMQIAGNGPNIGEIIDKAMRETS